MCVYRIYNYIYTYIHNQLDRTSGLFIDRQITGHGPHGPRRVTGHRTINCWLDPAIYGLDPQIYMECPHLDEIDGLYLPLTDYIILYIDYHFMFPWNRLLAPKKCVMNLG